MSEGRTMIIAYSGPNSFAMQQALKVRVQEFIATHGDFGVERLDASHMAGTALIESVQAMPFLAGKRLLIIQDPADNKQFVEEFPSSIDMISDDTDIIFIQSKFDKRSSFYKLLQKRAENHVFEELNEPALLRWISEYVAAEQGTIRSQDARYLIERVGISQRTLQSELDKLVSYSSTITKESIDLLTARSVQSTIFDLIEALFAGKTTKALDLYREQRMQKVEPLQIVAMIVWQLHILAIIKTGSGQSSDTIARDAKLNPYVVRKNSALAQKIQLEHIKSLVERTRDLERRLKRESIDADEALMELLIHFNQM
jgi:DNA polymerase-3 subunit delta